MCECTSGTRGGEVTRHEVFSVVAPGGSGERTTRGPLPRFDVVALGLILPLARASGAPLPRAP